MKWSEQEWKASHTIGENFVTIHCSAKDLEDIQASPAGMSEVLYRLDKTLRNGEKIENLIGRLCEAIQVGATSVNIRELLDFLNGGA